VKKPPPQNKLQITEATSWQGPLPPPAVLQQFDALVQNGAERIFRMAELEQQHRLEIQDKSLASDVEAQKNEVHVTWLGLYFGTAISVLSIAASLLSVYLGAHFSVSVALVSVPVMSVIRTIILRR
jgi:uncharacterized membrane protein